MARIVRLTESDINRLVRKVIMEEESPSYHLFVEKLDDIEEDMKKKNMTDEDLDDMREELENEKSMTKDSENGLNAIEIKKLNKRINSLITKLKGKYKYERYEPMRVKSRFDMDEQPEDIDSEDYSSLGEETYQKIRNASKREVDRFLENLPEDTRFILVSNCEYADFSSIDICSFPKLIMINLKGTDNNFDAQNYDCPFTDFGNGVYDFTPDY